MARNLVQQQFGSVADRYATSAVHAAGADLTQLVKVARLTGRETVLDAGCGAGHTALALAPQAMHVIAYDLTPEMLVQVERLMAEGGIANVTTQLGTVDALPFDDGSFDLVVSRYSAHHWTDPIRALCEFRRVLKPSGRFLLSDIVAPDEPVVDTYLQAIEVLRDPSHVRDFRETEWLAMMNEADMVGETIFRWTLPLEFGSWLARMATPDANAEMIRALLKIAPPSVHAGLGVQVDHGFSLQGALFVAERRNSLPA